MTKGDEARLALIRVRSDNYGYLNPEQATFLLRLLGEQAARVAALEAREAKLIEAGEWLADQHQCCGGEWDDRRAAIDAEFPAPVAPGEVKP